jgi:hypothetical protein
MAKLKCEHGRRVMVLEGGVHLHRQDGSKCGGTAMPTIGGKPIYLDFPMDQYFRTDTETYMHGTV